METKCKASETTLETIRGGINQVNERVINTNKRLEDKLDYLRGTLPESDSNSKFEKIEGYIKETNQVVGFLNHHTEETERLLNELFELI